MFSERATHPPVFDPVPLRVARESELLSRNFFNDDFADYYGPIALKMPDTITSSAVRFDHGAWLMPLAPRPEIMSLRNQGAILTERQILARNLGAWHWRDSTPFKPTMRYLQHHFATHAARGAIFRKDSVIGLYHAATGPFALMLPINGNGHDILIASQGIAEDYPGYFKLTS